MIASAEILAAVAVHHWYMEKMNTYKQHQNANRVLELAFTVPNRSYYQILLWGWNIYKLRFFSSHLPHSGSTPSICFSTTGHKPCSRRH